jgi:hypothetical protein
MFAGVFHVMAGAPGCTVMVTVADEEVKCVVSVGVKVTDTVCVPNSSTVPAGGVYVNVPGTAAPPEVTAALSCVDERAVP